MKPGRSIAMVQLVAAVALLTGCPSDGGKGKKNPVGADGVPPQVRFVEGPASGDTVRGDRVAVAWSASLDVEFRYRLDDGAWTPWSSDTACAELFDDGDHAVVVEARDLSSGAVGRDTVAFVVAALTAPAVYAVPRRATAVGGNVTVTVRGLGLPVVRSVKLVVSGGRVAEAAWPSGSSPEIVLLHDSTTANLGIGPGVAAPENNADLLVLTLVVDPPADTARVEFAECTVRDSTHQDVALGSLRGVVVVGGM